MKFSHLASAVAVAAVTLAGCSSQTPTTTIEQPGVNRPTASVTAEGVPSTAPTTAAPSTTDPTAGVHKFGETVKYPDGLAVKVVNSGEFKPGQYAAKPDAPKFLKMTFTVTNGTSKPYDPVIFYATMQSGNTEAQQVFDSAANLGMSPTTTVLPGRETTWVTGWGVTDPNDLVMSVAPGPFQYDKIIFASK